MLYNVVLQWSESGISLHASPPSSNAPIPPLTSSQSPPVLHSRFPLLSAFPTVVYICPACSLSSFPRCVRTSLLHVCVFAVSLKLLSVSLLVGYSSQEIHCGVEGDVVWNARTWGLPSRCHMTWSDLLLSASVFPNVSNRFSTAMGTAWGMCACSIVQSYPTVSPWDCSPSGSLSMGFSMQEYWSGLPFPTPGGLLTLE